MGRCCLTTTSSMPRPITIVTAPVGGAVSTMGPDMANVPDDGDTLRAVPILGKSSVQNLIDILRLRGVDMGSACLMLWNS